MTAHGSALKTSVFSPKLWYIAELGSLIGVVNGGVPCKSEVNMRVLAFFTVVVFSVFGAVLFAQQGGGPGGPRGDRGGGQQGGAQFQGVQARGQQDGGPRQFSPTQGQPGGPQRVQGGGMQGGGMQGGGMQGGGQFSQRGGQPPTGTGGRGQFPAQGNQAGRPMPQGTGQPPQARPMPQGGGQPQQNRTPQSGVMNSNQVSQMIARLRTMDTNQNGVLEASEIPANQQGRVNMMISQLGGTPGAATYNLANLERRAMLAAGGAQSNASQQSDPTRQQRQQSTTSPLVPPFGEQVAAGASPLGFGQRDSVQSTSQGRGRGGQRDSGVGNRPQSAVPPPVTVRTSTPYENIPAALRTNQEFRWFFECDTNQDGQVSMAEYVAGNGGIWTEVIAGEFSGFGRVLDRNGNEYFDVGLDRNGDGFATMDEALITVKERTERLAQEEAVAARAAGSSSGQQAPQQGRQYSDNSRATSGTNQPRQQQFSGDQRNNQQGGRPQGLQQGRSQGAPQDGQRPMGGAAGGRGGNQSGGGPGGGRGGRGGGGGG